MSGHEPIFKNKGAQPNTEAKILIDEARSNLKAGVFEGVSELLLSGVSDSMAMLKHEKNIGSIDRNEKKSLVDLNSNTDKAKILVTADNKGAVVLSSTGSITLVGSMPDDDNDMANTHLKYIGDEVEKALSNDGLISASEQNRLKGLGRMMKDVGLVISDDGKSAVIGNINGHTEIIDADYIKNKKLRQDKGL